MSPAKILAVDDEPAAAGSASGEIAEIVTRLEDRGEQPLRGRNEPVRIWARPGLSVEE